MAKQRIESLVYHTSGTKTVQEIVTEMANLKVVEKMIERIAQRDPDTYWRQSLKDLAQDVYVHLMTKIPAEKLISLYANDELRPYVIRILQVAIKSSKSEYHKIYRGKTLRHAELTEDLLTEQEFTITEDE